MKAAPYIQNKKYNYKLSNPKNDYCKGAPSQHKHKEKNNSEKAFSLQIFQKDFFHFKSICFDSTSVSDQFKTKIGNYNTTSFISSFLLFKYLYVWPLNFIAREQIITQKAYGTEGLSLSRPLAFVHNSVVSLDLAIH